MRKLLVFVIAGLMLVSPVASVVEAQELSLAQIVELFISLDIIPAEKAAQARSAVATIAADQPASGTTAGSGGTCYSASITRWLTVGSSGAEVTALQEFLAKFPTWYPEGTVSGFFGPLTEKGLQRYQAAKKLVTSGTPATSGYGATGPKTREALGKCHTWTGNVAPGTTSGESFITTPKAGAVYPLDQLGLITIQLGQGENIATQARFYIAGGAIKGWKLLGTEQFNHRPSTITHTFAPQNFPELLPETAYAVLVSVDQWEVSKYVNKENVYLATPLFFSRAGASGVISGATVLNSSILTVPGKGSVYSLNEPVQISTRLRTLSTNTATRARFYVFGGVITGKTWKLMGTQESLHRPTEMTFTFDPAAATHIPERSTTTVPAFSNGIPYSVLVSIDEWQTDRYVAKENINLPYPIYFTDNVAHTALLAPSRGLLASDERWQVYNELRKNAAEGDISVDAFDLNDDGVNEVIGYARSRTLCQGTLCPLTVWRRFGSTEANYRWQSFFFNGNKSVLAPEAVMVLTSSKNGWRDIAMIANDGLYNVWRYDGGAYRLDYKVVSLLPGAIQISTAATSTTSVVIDTGAATIETGSTGGTTSGGTTSGGTTSGGTTSGDTTSGTVTTGSIPPPPPPPPPPM